MNKVRALSNTRQVPKGVIIINRKKPKIEKYDNSPTVFSYQLTPTNIDKQSEMSPMEE